MNYVVGSGPAGVAAAHALLLKGSPVTMLDVGRTLEKDKSELLSHLKTLPSSQWPPEKIHHLKGTLESTRKGIPLKKIYGSDFAYRELTEIEAQPSSTLLRASHARGGLSNVWGAVMLPFSEQDMDAWPFHRETLEPHYQKVLEFMNISGVHDDLEKIFPLYTESLSPLRVSTQGTNFLEHLGRHKDQLRNAGVCFGQSRLAVRAESSKEGPGCVYCGLCLTGCPYELIYNSAFTLEVLKKNPLFQYRPHTEVTTFTEDSKGVHVTVKDTKTSATEILHGTRLYLAGGSISTAMIVLMSLNLFDRELELKTNQYFVLPFLTKEKTTGVLRESLHTLCQAFVELISPDVSSRTVSLQMYGYNEHFSVVLKNIVGPLSFLFRPFVSKILERLLVFQGYLHSDESPSIKIKLVKTPNGDRLHMEPRGTELPRNPLRKMRNKLWDLRRELGGWPLNYFLSVGKIGDGSHVGGTFPMMKQPGPLGSDLWGRPCGLQKVHVVDSSVLPSIPATTITLSVMANAHRIASWNGES